MQSVSGLLILGHKYHKTIIDEFGGDIELWAAVKIQVGANTICLTQIVELPSTDSMWVAVCFQEETKVV